MPTVAVHGDIAGGTVTATATKCFVGGKPVVRVGDQVKDHGKGKHDSATMAEGSPVFIVEGLPVCVTGDLATCEHAIAGTGVQATAT